MLYFISKLPRTEILSLQKLHLKKNSTAILYQQIIHYFLHLIFPGIVAYLFFRKNWKRAYLVMLLTMLVDLDHLLADPIFDPNRCSIGFHYLHRMPAIIIYAIMFIYPKTRVAGLGLLMHMGTDYLDCLLMNTDLVFPLEI